MFSVWTEFNPVQQPLLNEKVLRDKRKKLRETFERIVHLYERENPDTYKELRKLELDYETKRGQLALYFDSVKVCKFCGLVIKKTMFLCLCWYLVEMKWNIIGFILWVCFLPCFFRMQSQWRWTVFLYQTCLTPPPTSTSRTSHYRGPNLHLYWRRPLLLGMLKLQLIFWIC